MTSSINSMRLAACGIDCSECGLYNAANDLKAAEQCVDWFRGNGWIKEDGDASSVQEVVKSKVVYCDGCWGNSGWCGCGSIDFRLCCNEKKILHCGECIDFPCEAYEVWVGFHDNHRKAKEYLSSLGMGSKKAQLNGIHKRKATTNDIEALIILRKQQLLEEGESISEMDEALYNFFSASLSDGTFVSFVMEKEGEIVATSGVCFYTLPPSSQNPTGKVAYITNMYTKEKFRRMGIASELLNSLLGEARARNCSIARLHTSKSGRNVYLKAGFTDSEGYMALVL